ncbi:Zn-dependent hydrolase [uncultured Dokdonia sp.]|uniref:Zn-dependent hydrolase n=1 Tax=uncultured Dokdonia sp. TaxID=575653 RepID=UPI002632BE9A|nr:Zn-dependent hydrolase [uncultured Dokdonia sp.]
MKTTLSFLTFFLILSITYAQMPKVNQDRLEKSIFELAEFGKKENGETSRVAFSQADIESRTHLISLMKDAGLEVSIDYAGNIIGRKAGSDPSKKPIAFGSHTDTVPDGGNYDGCVGSMAAIEVVKTLQENNITTQHPLELIIFSNEEGGVMGSRALAGELPADALTIVNSTGISMGDGIKVLGGDPTKLKEVIRTKGSLAAFLELHIEQGGILDQEQIDIGVVEGIVGLNWWDVTIEGFANHAGTTPMNARQDALLTAAQFIIAVNEVTTSFEGKQVGTVGRIQAAPGAPNVIPGKVTLSLEIRDLSAKKIKEVYAAIEKRGQEIVKETNTKITFTALSTTGKPALTDTRIQQQIAKATKTLGLSQIQMQSGAGHDAQDMALIAPTGMIFIPSKNGISHSPKEYTSAEDMANGANVLLQTILLLDQE